MASGGRTAAWLSALPTVTVVQPAHLETSDASLATEILPAPPPLSAVTAAGKKELKRPYGALPVVTYLPAFDPGSTFSSAYAQTFSEQPASASAAAASTADANTLSRRPKRARLLGRFVSSRPKPPPATTATTATYVPSTARGGSPVEHEREQSVSSQSVGGPPEMDDGDGAPAVATTALAPGAPLQDLLLVRCGVAGGWGHTLTHAGQHNDDHCSSCRSHGSLVYCDGCPRAFHLWCVDPPIEPDDLPHKDAAWLCPACQPPLVQRRSKLDANPLIGPLYAAMRAQLPREFQLPPEIRTFFRDVATGPRGTYLGGGKVPRPSRNGVVEDREPFRLRNRDNDPVLCYHCAKTAFSSPSPPRGASPPQNASHHRPTSPSHTSDPDGAPAAKRQRLSNARTDDDPADDSRRWRGIVSCDYCDLHWHLDCLDPPLTVMPPRGHKWMCPNHIDHVLASRRVPRHIHKAVDVSTAGVMNNGFIDIIPAEESSPVGPSIDEVFIAGTRYRVPERVVLLDFWERCRRVTPVQPPPPSDSELDAIRVLTQLRGGHPAQAPLPAAPPSVSQSRQSKSAPSMASKGSKSASSSRHTSSKASGSKSSGLSHPAADDFGLLPLNGGASSSGPASTRSPGSTLSTLTPTPPPSPPKIMLKIRLPPRPPNSQQSQQPPHSQSGQSHTSDSAPRFSPVASTSHVSPGKIILPAAAKLALAVKSPAAPEQRQSRRAQRQSAPSTLGALGSLNSDSGVDVGAS